LLSIPANTAEHLRLGSGSLTIRRQDSLSESAYGAPPDRVCYSFKAMTIAINQRKIRSFARQLLCQCRPNPNWLSLSAQQHDL
jgi:hypothetical protein